MRRQRFMRVGGATLAMLALGLLLLVPGRVSALAVPASGNVSVNANVYLTENMLQPLFQSNIDQQIPQTVSAVIASMVHQLPQADQDWASEMANALLQPSATLVSVQPQAKGLLVTLRLSLYQGDPKPITSSLLVGFSVSNSSTIQVTALPINGKTGLVSGPLLSFHMPIGTLNTVSALTTCGDAEIGINLKFPITLGAQSQPTGQTRPTGSALSSFSGSTSSQVTSATSTYSDRFSNPTNPQATPASSAYIELPAASLAQLGSSLGTMTVSTSLTANNIHVSTQGSNLMLVSDIHWHGLLIGNAVSTVVPGAANGDLVMHVTKTDLKILDGLMTFPLNKYNQQTEQMLNSELSGALTGKFTVDQATIGANAHVPCAASSSLVLGGKIVLN